MKPRLGWTRDPALHLIVLVLIVLAASGAFSAGPKRRASAGAVPKHPPGCHACTYCSPELAAQRDAFLIRIGSIDPANEAE